MTPAIFTSTVADGTMRTTPTEDVSSVERYRHRFMHKNDLDPTDITWVNVVFDGQDYCRYREVGVPERGDGISRPPTLVADALITTQPDQGLFLPLADCIGAAIHDPMRNILMLSHLGRQSLEQQGGTKSVQYLVKHYGVNPQDLTVWFSPAAGKQNYPVHAFDDRGLHEIAVEQITSAGVPVDNVDVSPIDTATNEHYFSHSEFLKGNRDTDGRFAVITAMEA